MNKRFFSLLLFLSIGTIVLTKCGSAKINDKMATSDQTESKSRNLIIYYDPSVGKEKLLEAMEAYSAKLLYDYENLHGLAIEIPTSMSLEKAIAYFKKLDGVISVSRDEIMQITEPQH